MNSVDAMSVNSGLKQAIRQKLTVPVPDRLADPNVFGAAVSLAETRMSRGESLKDIVTGIGITRNFPANDKQKLIQTLTQKQKDDSVPASGGSVDAVRAIAGGVKNAFKNPGVPFEPTATQ